MYPNPYLNEKIKARVFVVVAAAAAAAAVRTIRRETTEKAAFERRRDSLGRHVTRGRDNHIVVHVQPAAEATVGHGSRRPDPRRTVQLGRTAARHLPAGDQRPVGQVQRARHRDDHHENGQVSASYD